MATFVLVAGAWLGGWCWRHVAPILRNAGHDVVTPSLTGLGARAHLLTPTVGLDTHVLDLENLFVSRDLRDVILVGHSYGGTVITSAAERIPDRLRCLTYLDGSVPNSGQSNNDVLPGGLAEQIRESARQDGDGWRVPPPSVASWGLDADTVGWVESRLTPHPLKSLEDPVRLRTDPLPVLRAFLRTSPPTSFYQRFLEQGRSNGWYCRELAGGHFAMLRAPQAVATVLLDLERDCGRRSPGVAIS
jgi:pimeloyl-ACP methyl ester carboxylesterase